MLFTHLVSCGFKEIEVAYPSSSDTEFEFVRGLVENGQIPDDVWIQVRASSSPLSSRLMRTVTIANTIGDDPRSGGADSAHVRGHRWGTKGDREFVQRDGAMLP